MDIAEKTEKCAHPPCKCAASAAGEYCSEHCRNAAGKTETECKCGHPDCG
jgi:hypothetical protein